MRGPLHSFRDCPGIDSRIDAVGTGVALASLLCSLALTRVLWLLHKRRAITLGRRYWTVLMLNAASNVLWSIFYIMAFSCDEILTAARTKDQPNIGVFGYGCRSLHHRRAWAWVCTWLSHEGVSGTRALRAATSASPRTSVAIALCPPAPHHPPLWRDPKHAKKIAHSPVPASPLSTPLLHAHHVADRRYAIIFIGLLAGALLSFGELALSVVMGVAVMGVATSSELTFAEAETVRAPVRVGGSCRAV